MLLGLFSVLTRISWLLKLLLLVLEALHFFESRLADFERRDTVIVHKVFFHLTHLLVLNLPHTERDLWLFESLAAVVCSSCYQAWLLADVCKVDEAVERYYLVHVVYPGAEVQGRIDLGNVDIWLLSLHGILFEALSELLTELSLDHEREWVRYLAFARKNTPNESWSRNSDRVDRAEACLREAVLDKGTHIELQV